MTEPTSAQDLFKGRHFDQEIIVLCVRWFLAFKLSSRDLVQMMAERTVSNCTFIGLLPQTAVQYGIADSGSQGPFWRECYDLE